MCHSAALAQGGFLRPVHRGSLRDVQERTSRNGFDELAWRPVLVGEDVVKDESRRDEEPAIIADDAKLRVAQDDRLFVTSDRHARAFVAEAAHVPATRARRRVSHARCEETRDKRVARRAARVVVPRLEPPDRDCA